MKRFFYFSVSVFLLSLSALIGFHLGTGGAEAQGLENQRYQLYLFNWETLGKDGHLVHLKDIFKLDTATGRVSKYVTGYEDTGQYFSFWAKTEKP